MPENPAARAHDLMVKAKPGNGKAFQVWASVFGLPEGASIPVVTSYLVELYQQIEAAEREANEIFPPDTAAVKLKHFPTLKRSLLSFDLNGNFDTIRNVMSDAALDTLESLAHDLDDEPRIEQANIDTISESLNDLFKEVEGSNLNKNLKKFVMTWLAKIRRALDQYRITGTRGLQDALSAIQGEAANLAPVVEKIEKEAPTIWKKFEGFYCKTFNFVGFLDRCRKLCESPTLKLGVHLGLKKLGFDPGSDPPNIEQQ